MHISVCICTYHRPALLTRLLQELEKQDTGDLFTYSVVVVDNDAQQSAKATAAEFAKRLELVYCVEPERNIAAVRNTAVRQAQGDFIAFIDDDEYPEKDWLLQLFKTCTEHNVAGVLGPVEPYFEEASKARILDVRIFVRPRHETGHDIDWTGCRTGNVLIRRSILAGVAEPFDRKFGTGGEDMDFFRRMSEQKHVFIWCDEAVAHELVPKERQTRRYLLRRAFYRGQVSLKYPTDRLQKVVKSLIALPLYTLALPFLALASGRLFMWYLIKISDHGGRLLTFCGLKHSKVRADEIVLKLDKMERPAAVGGTAASAATGPQSRSQQSPLHISVCICTYQRAAWLKRLLTELGRLKTDGLFAYSIVVADNDPAESGRAVVEEMRRGCPIEMTYGAEPARSISLVRNLTIALAKGDAIAFIDDDEFPENDWLLNHYLALTQHQVAGVLGPVRPFFDDSAPKWIRRSRLYDRPEHPTGFVMSWTETRTGNVLFHKRIVQGLDPVFLPQFAASGGDMDFFRRMMEKGHKFIWCNEAVVHEYVPPKRWKRSVLLSRGLLRGHHSYLHPEGRGGRLIKAAAAVPLYAVALPFLHLGGHHLFMRYLVKLCFHMGTMLGALGINPVREREM